MLHSCGELTSVLHTLTEWLKSHTLLYTFVLFLLSAFLSIYSQEIKRFLHSWPRTAEAARRHTLQNVTYQLALLKTLHNDSYRLLLYFADKFTTLIFEWLGLMIILTVIGIVRKARLEPGIYFGLMAGSFIGTVQDVRGMLVRLARYDESVAKLQQQISELNTPVT